MSAEFGGVEHAFGRVEAKLDTIDGKIDRHAERLAEHGVRLTTVEDDVRSLKAELAGEHGYKRTGRQLVIASLASGGTGSLLTWLITTLSAHH